MRKRGGRFTGEGPMLFEERAREIAIEAERQVAEWRKQIRKQMEGHSLTGRVRA